MKSISSLAELNIPKKHQLFITNFLRQAKEISTFNQIDAFILFGSCARGDAHEKSDVDILAVGDGIGDETLFDLYDCEWFPEREHKEYFVNSDVFVNDKNYFDEQKQVVGSFQWRVNKDGVNLNGLF
ncbi:MAG: nucleotidyltransferase domain-containing protein [Defluviitaleaceae bacterium]|nr:nucleotidyltransferase domain-containing protein [Defluviitaleaceae bacterium]MCL2276030.1 nucleotidyltransferase domain-containing protein [Defluviitaleaceae bacterium]